MSCMPAMKHTRVPVADKLEASLSDKDWHHLCIHMQFHICIPASTVLLGGQTPSICATPPSFTSNFFFSGRCHSPIFFFIPCILPSSPHPSLPFSSFFVSSSCWHKLHFLLETSVRSLRSWIDGNRTVLIPKQSFIFLQCLLAVHHKMLWKDKLNKSATLHF